MIRRLSSRELASLRSETESKEKMPPEEREKWVNQKLARQVKFAYRNAPAVKERFDKAGVSPSEVRTIKDLEKLPVTKKDELLKLQQAKPPFGGFLAVPVTDLKRIYVSPGPIYDAWGDERVKAAVRGTVRSGWPRPGDIVLVANAYHMVPAGLFLTDTLDAIGCTVVPAGTGQTELQVKLLHDLQCTAIYSFPSFVMTILKKAEEMGYNVRKDFNLKYVTGGGERHIQVLRKVFEEHYGLKVGDGYGTADLGTVAYDCGLGQGYHYDDFSCLIEIVDPDSGKQVRPREVGEVVVTLFSDIYPLVRFGTGDLASYVDEVCACGRTAPRITKILGMVGDHIRVKGMFVHLRELDDAMSKFPRVSRYQMVLKLDEHRDRITLKVEAEEGVNKDALSKEINARCQDVFKLKMDNIEFLSKGTLAADYKKFLDTRWQ
ncbi:MAG: AMP-binding protein [Chloroflexi bacterium]|nr:AMP-binding protein [Chloroflexota bacterium]